MVGHFVTSLRSGFFDGEFYINWEIGTMKRANRT